MAIDSSYVIILGISAAILIGVSVFFLSGEEIQSSSLTTEEITKIEKNQNIPRQFIEITNDNPEFFEQWCSQQDGNWEANISGIGGFCYFDSKVKKNLAELEWDELQHPVITGDSAQKICNVLDLDCPSDAEFEGWFDDEEGYKKLEYTLHDREYFFRLSEDGLEYSNSGNSDTWISYDEVFGRILSFELSDHYYFSGDEIQISGHVFDHAINDFDQIPVIIQIFFGDELVEIAQIPISPDNSFSYNVKTEGPLWQQSGRYTVSASYDSRAVQKEFGFSNYYHDKTTKYFADLDSEDYEELCGYPVTQEMQRDFIESWKSRPGDKDPYLTIRKGTFSHVERSQYLTAMPILHYWYDLKNGQQTYFAMEACSLDDILFRGEPGPGYEKPRELVIDGVNYVEFNVPGGPLLFQDTLLPVLDVDNCKRVANEATKHERQKLFMRENTELDHPWANQIFPLMDYCLSIGDFELKTIDGDIKWNFILN